jgi:hypothetical protein
MNWRRGLFRLWIVGTALFVIAVAAVSYSSIKAEFTAADEARAFADQVYKRFYSDIPREQFDMKIAENPEPSAQLEAILAQLERSTIGNAASLIVKGIRFQKAEESRSPAPYSG